MAASGVDRGPIRIRSATLADADTIFGLLGQLGKSYIPERPAFDTAFADALRNADDHVLLVAAGADDRPLGYALTTIARLFYTNGTTAQLQEIVVDEASRGSRIGSALVTAVERECRARGVRQLTVASIRAAAFYEGLDYRSTADFLKKTFDD
ncbi:MAG: N-acetyltransferase [Microbacteriaceae bacterium]|nr:N-acetyltransferase [Microbacteriaceae bacterium]